MAITLHFNDIALRAGFTPEPYGKFNLPATQETADKLAYAATTLFFSFEPGNDPVDIVLTDFGPVWGYLAIAHALHGLAARLAYAAPNAPMIVIYDHGFGS